MNRRATPKTDPLGRERRVVALNGVSVRKANEDGSIPFKGHAAVFGSRTWIGPKRWGFFEEVDKGAFAKTLGEADVRFLINHNPDLVLARNTASTLRLEEDDTGLATDADMAPTTYGQDLAISLERGDVSQMSFAFEVVKEEWTELEDGNQLRTLKELKLYDVSAVTYPAYEDTDAGVRAAALDVLAGRSINDDLRARVVEAFSHEEDVRSILEEIASRSEPAKTTPDDEPPEPAETTRDLGLYQLRTQALGALLGKPAA